MTEQNPGDRLSQLSTAWTTFFQAHADGLTDSGPAARRRLIERYGLPVYRYLRAAVRHPDAADELFQEFALRLVRGDFHSANPARGRFRDFLKTALYHLVVDHRRREVRRPAALPEIEPASAEPPATIESDEAFTRGWREQILARSWTALAEHEQATGQLLHTVLRYRADHPEARSAEMAAALSVRVGRSIDAGWVRKRLHQAREQFADLIIADIAGTLDPATVEAVAEELLDLDLLEYCRDALERYRTTATAPPK